MFMNQPAANQPMNRYSLWKYLLIIIILVVGVIYALPNLYGEDPSIQISPQRDAALNSELEQTIQTVLNESSIEFTRIDRDSKAMIIRFKNTESQLSAQYAIDKAIRDAFGNDQYTVAMNLAPATPQWLRDLSASPMKLGLDLRGGIHFLMEVDMKTAVDKRENQYLSDFKADLRKEKIRYVRPIVRVTGGGVQVKFKDTKLASNIKFMVR